MKLCVSSCFRTRDNSGVTLLNPCTGTRIRPSFNAPTQVGACVIFYGGHPNVKPDLANLQSPALGLVLRTICEATGWALGQAWLPSADTAHLQCSPAWYTTVNGADQFRVRRHHGAGCAAVMADVIKGQFLRGSDQPSAISAQPAVGGCSPVAEAHRLFADC